MYVVVFLRVWRAGRAAHLMNGKAHRSPNRTLRLIFAVWRDKGVGFNLDPSKRNTD
jgi:hypothetical protein